MWLNTVNIVLKYRQFNVLLEKILRCICIETLFASLTPCTVGEIIIWSAAELIDILYLTIKMKLAKKN